MYYPHKQVAMCLQILYVHVYQFDLLKLVSIIFFYHCQLSLVDLAGSERVAKTGATAEQLKVS